MIPWNLILSDSNDAFSNMSIDEALLDSAIEGEIDSPTLRFYTWSTPSISLGRFQEARQDIKVEECEVDHIPIVRRPTGGRAVFHGTEKEELTYSVVLPANFPLAKLGIQATYCSISEAFVSGLNQLGIMASLEKQTIGNKKYADEISCFSATTRYEVNLSDHKIIGSAQVRKHQAILQQGSIILGTLKNSTQYFQNGINPQKGIQDILGKEINRTEFINSLINGFQKVFKIELKKMELSERIIVRSVQARQYKYTDPQWTFSK